MSEEQTWCWRHKGLPGSGAVFLGCGEGEGYVDHVRSSGFTRECGESGISWWLWVVECGVLEIGWWWLGGCGWLTQIRVPCVGAALFAVSGSPSGIRAGFPVMFACRHRWVMPLDWSAALDSFCSMHLWSRTMFFALLLVERLCATECMTVCPELLLPCLSLMLRAPVLTLFAMAPLMFRDCWSRPPLPDFTTARCGTHADSLPVPSSSLLAINLLLWFIALRVPTSLLSVLDIQLATFSLVIRCLCHIRCVSGTAICAARRRCLLCDFTSFRYLIA